MNSSLFLLVVVFVPVLVSIPLILAYSALEKRGVPLRKMICYALGYSPLILVLVKDYFPMFFESWGVIIIGAIIFLMFWAMAKWGETANGIESICALAAVFYGLQGFYQSMKFGSSFDTLLDSFIFFMCGIGYFRYILKSQKQ